MCLGQNLFNTYKIRHSQKRVCFHRWSQVNNIHRLLLTFAKTQVHENHVDVSLKS